MHTVGEKQLGENALIDNLLQFFRTKCGDDFVQLHGSERKDRYLRQIAVCSQLEVGDGHNSKKTKKSDDRLNKISDMHTCAKSNFEGVGSKFCSQGGG